MEGRIVIFNSYPISKVVHLALKKNCAYFYCRTVEYYEKELYLARKKNKNKKLYPM